jgi:CheY-like chemotaxis protein
MSSSSSSGKIHSCASLSSTAIEGKNLRVLLLVDDSLTITQVIGRALRQRGYEVATANNGSAGLDRLMQGHATQDFDFVLMDLQIPVMVKF